MDDFTRRMIMGAAGAAGDKTYVDDIFNTQVYAGNGTSSHTQTTGIDMTNDFLLWTKRRSSSESHYLFDSKRMSGSNYISAFTNLTAVGNSRNWITAGSNGYTINDNDNAINASGSTYASWTFRQAPGFFDVVKFTGTGGTNASPQTINHSLESIPGMIIIKNLTQASNWFVYHKSTGVDKFLLLNLTNAALGYNGGFKNITSSSIDVFDSNSTNTNEFIAYVFAGGASTAATARSVDFDVEADGLNVAASSDINFGTGTFCVEGWVYVDSLPGGGYGRFFQLDGPSGNTDIKNLQVTIRPSDTTVHAWSYDGSTNVSISGSVSLLKGWHHIAVVRDSNNLITQYVDGTPDGTASSITTDFSPNSGSPRPAIGHYPQSPTGGFIFNGKISNVRVTVGEPVYTAAFKPSTSPLTTTSQGVTSSNVKLLCCNNSSTTGSTVTSGTISAVGTPTALTDSPFDDPSGFVFGENEDQNIIKTGSYQGNGNADGPEVFLGWEPQYVLIKNTTTLSWWRLHDSMRGITTDGNDKNIYPNDSSPEDNNKRISLTGTGFKLTSTNNGTNSNGDTFMYMAIRRPDGHVGKPASAGTSVFAIDTGNGGSPFPTFDSGFPVDYALYKNNTTEAFYTSARLKQGNLFETSSNVAAATYGAFVFDSNVGWDSDGAGTGHTSWMWKRHTGFDVVTYKGNGTSGLQIGHSMNKIPEMMWVKNVSSAEDWGVYHSGLYDGYGPTDSPQNYALRLNLNAGIMDNTTYWNDTAPTATHFTLGNNDSVNKNNDYHIAMLFNSVTGISKCGYYIGNHSAREITTGFQPRFLIIKGLGNGTDNEWVVLDTTRGWASGVDNYFVLNSTAAQTNALDAGQPTSTGFTLTGGDDYRRWNDSGVRYIYYAHA